eukprot:1589373-Amphidinium_carterae.1
MEAGGALTTMEVCRTTALRPNSVFTGFPSASAVPTLEKHPGSGPPSLCALGGAGKLGQLFPCCGPGPSTRGTSLSRWALGAHTCTVAGTDTSSA